MKKYIMYCLLFVILDQMSKYFADTYNILNPGFIFGNLGQTQRLVRTVFTSLIGTYCFILYLVLLYLFKHKNELHLFKLGLSFFSAGLLGNAFDKIRLDAVRDFIPLLSIKLNMADIEIALGFIILCITLIKDRELIWFPNEKRGKILVNKEFQGEAALYTSLIVLFSASTQALFCYSYLKSYIKQDQEVAFTFIIGSLILTIIGMLGSYIIAIKFTHRSSGAIFAFQQYLRKRDQGEYATFQLRIDDYHQDLAETAKIVERLNLPEIPE